jgi:poly(A) polymerase
MNLITIPWTPERRHALVALRQHRLLRHLQTFAARAGGMSLYVVGGTLRDVCLARDVQDIDVALAGDVMAFARAFADAHGAAYVPLDAQRGEARVVSRQRGNIDFARLRGRDIAADLRRRDFTVNALACPLTALLTASEPAFLDPCGGWPDLQARLIRMVAPQSFEDDPLRLLRAFRLAAVLDFALEPDTQAAMPLTVPRLAGVAAERIQSELLKLFAAPHSSPRLCAMAQLGLLAALFPELEATHRMSQGEGSSEEYIVHALHTYQAVEDLINDPTLDVPSIAAAMAHYVHTGERAALLKWAALLHGIGPYHAPPDLTAWPSLCRSDATRAAAMWEQVAVRLKVSRARAEYVKRLIAHHRRPFVLASLEAQGGLTLRFVHQWFKELGEDVLGAFALAIGEVRAGQGLEMSGDGVRSLAHLAARLWEIYGAHIRPVLQGPRLLTGDDLQSLFGLSPGPSFKTLLDELEVAQIEGRLRTRDEALRWMEQRLRMS